MVVSLVLMVEIRVELVLQKLDLLLLLFDHVQHVGRLLALMRMLMLHLWRRRNRMILIDCEFC